MRVPTRPRPAIKPWWEVQWGVNGYWAWVWHTHPAFTLHLLEHSAKNGVDPRLVASVINQESGWNAKAVSPVGARGLMQIMPFNFGWLGLTKPHDPYQNSAAGIRYLGGLVKQYQGDWKAALAHYNGGHDGVRYYRSGWRRCPVRLDCHQVKHYVLNIERIKNG